MGARLTVRGPLVTLKKFINEIQSWHEMTHSKVVVVRSEHFLICDRSGRNTRTAVVLESASDFVEFALLAKPCFRCLEIDALIGETKVHKSRNSLKLQCSPVQASGIEGRFSCSEVADHSAHYERGVGDLREEGSGDELGDYEDLESYEMRLGYAGCCAQDDC